MEDYVTVVSVDDGVNQGQNQRHLIATSPTHSENAADSSFITVLSINDSVSPMKENQTVIRSDREREVEEVLVYRLPGERLGFGLKFQGGTKSNERIQRLFIQSCTPDSPASRVEASWGFLKEGDEILSIDGQLVQTMTRMECVRCLKESNVAIKLLVRNGDFVTMENGQEEKPKTMQHPPPPPPVPPRKLLRKKQPQDKQMSGDEKPFTPPPDAEYYINLFSDENSVVCESESDDTGSTVSTVIDKFSIGSNMSSESDLSTYSTNGHITITNGSGYSNGNGTGMATMNKSELAKVLQPFTLLEEEFNVDSSAKLEECLKKLEPSVKVKQAPMNNYENVELKSELKPPAANPYENVEVKVLPRPKPRQLNYVEARKRPAIPIPRKVPIPEVPPLESQGRILEQINNTKIEDLEDGLNLKDRIVVIHRESIENVKVSKRTKVTSISETKSEKRESHKEEVTVSHSNVDESRKNVNKQEVVKVNKMTKVTNVSRETTPEKRETHKEEVTVSHSNVEGSRINVHNQEVANVNKMIKVTNVSRETTPEKKELHKEEVTVSHSQVDGPQKNVKEQEVVKVNKIMKVTSVSETKPEKKEEVTVSQIQVDESRNNVNKQEVVPDLIQTTIKHSDPVSPRSGTTSTFMSFKAEKIEPKKPEPKVERPKVVPVEKVSKQTIEPKKSNTNFEMSFTNNTNLMKDLCTLFIKAEAVRQPESPLNQIKKPSVSSDHKVTKSKIPIVKSDMKKHPEIENILSEDKSDVKQNKNIVESTIAVKLKPVVQKQKSDNDIKLNLEASPRSSAGETDVEQKFVEQKQETVPMSSQSENNSQKSPTSKVKDNKTKPITPVPPPKPKSPTKISPPESPKTPTKVNPVRPQVSTAGLHVIVDTSKTIVETKPLSSSPRSPVRKEPPAIPVKPTSPNKKSPESPPVKDAPQTNSPTLERAQPKETNKQPLEEVIVKSPSKTEKPAPPLRSPTTQKTTQIPKPNSNTEIRFKLQAYDGTELETDIMKGDKPNVRNLSRIPAKVPLFDENGNESKSLPRLINFVPKSKSPEETKEPNPRQQSVIATEEIQNSKNLEEPESLPIGKCIRISCDENNDTYMDSSSDEDEEKIYEIEEGEKLGPPELINGPGPSEAYFNFHWHTNMLPTIGEVEEEFSSLEMQSTGPLVVVNTSMLQNYRYHQQTPQATTTNPTSTIKLTNTPVETSAPSEQQVHSNAEVSCKTKLNIADTRNENSNEMTEMPVCSENINSGASLENCSVQDKIKTIDTTKVLAVDFLKSAGKRSSLESERPKMTNVQRMAESDVKQEHENENDVICDKKEEIKESISAAEDERKDESVKHLQNECAVKVTVTEKVVEVNGNANGEEHLVEATLKLTEIVKPHDKKSDVVENVLETEEEIPTTSQTQAKEIIKFTRDMLAAEVYSSSVNPPPVRKSEAINVEKEISSPEVDNLDLVQKESVSQDIVKVFETDKETGETLGSVQVPPLIQGEVRNDNTESVNTKLEQSLKSIDEIHHEDNEKPTPSSRSSISSVSEEASTKPTVIDRIIVGVENENENENQNQIKSESVSDSELELSEKHDQETASELKVSVTTMESTDTTDTTDGKKGNCPSNLTNVPETNLISNSSKDMKMDGTGKMISAPLIINDYITINSPPTYSRLPPDGHEFPPNFSEPLIIPTNLKTMTNTTTPLTETQRVTKKTIDQNDLDDRPPLPKSGPPPTVPRRVYRQDLVIKCDDSRADKKDKYLRLDQASPKISAMPPSSLFDGRWKTVENIEPSRKPEPGLRKISDWRKDEKSEKSVRDKIAMFSNDDQVDFARSKKPMNKSTENLLDSGSKYQTLSSSLTKKAMSVENLHDVTKNNYKNKSIYDRTKPEDGQQSVLSAIDYNQSYASLPRRTNPAVSRTISFSGQPYNVDETSRKAAISNILEHRRKSMSKLRGLVIPDRSSVPSSSLETIIDLPEIKSLDSEKVKVNGITSKIGKPEFKTTPLKPVSINTNYMNGNYKSVFSSLNRLNTTSRKLENNNTLPPAKPPRTSLILTKSSAMEESDSDSVFSSKISSPPMSPNVPAVPEKFALTRTLSSETNTSIASSTTSTLTSGSGSQASCSSIGSTPTVDMSRRVIKSGSGDSTVNRKNILASAKCRSGRDDTSALIRNRRYDDGDSTDGCEEDEVRRAPKPKQRNSINTPNKNVVNTPINYKLVGKDVNVVDKVISVASYVEVTSDTDDSSRKSDSNPSKVSAMFIDEERKASFKADPVKKIISAKVERKPEIVPFKKSTDNTDLAKWVRSEAAKARVEAKKFETVTQQCVEKLVPQKAEFITIGKSPEPPKPMPKIKSTTSEIREKFEARAQQAQVHIQPQIISPTNNLKQTKEKPIYHERFSSLDSIASSSSGVSSSTQNMQSNQETGTEFGSFSSLGSNQSLITAQDVQLIIEEADPPLKNPEAFIVVLQRDTPESSIGVTLAGGSDYEAKEITIHKILSNSPAAKDGRLKKGDRILAVNGLSMRGLTHRESITVLKTPRPEVVLVVTRSESVVVKPLAKKRSSLGSLTSLTSDKPVDIEYEKKRNYHKASRSLDLDLDIVSNEDDKVKETNLENSKMNGNLTSSSVEIITRSSRERIIRDISKPSSVVTLKSVKATSRIQTNHKLSNGVSINNDYKPGAREIQIVKDSCGLGFSIEGGYDSPLGNRPLLVKKVFIGGAAQKAGNIEIGDEILAINGSSTEKMTRVDAWNYMKQLPSGPVKIVIY